MVEEFCGLMISKYFDDDCKICRYTLIAAAANRADIEELALTA